MSQQSQLAKELGGAEDKPTNDFVDDAKYRTEDSTTDSGFISSGNLMISGEIETEEPSGHIDGTNAKPPASTDLDAGVVTSMKFDSGVHLSESFSNLSVQNKESAKLLNDLNSKCSIALTADKDSASTNADQQDLWKIYYEQDEDGDTQLHMAIVQHFIEVTFALICAAPHPRLLDTVNDDGQTPLHLAAATGQSQVVRWLVVAGARLSVRNLRGDSPLHVAAEAGDLATCKALTDPIKRQEREQLQLKYDASVAVGADVMDLNQWNYDGQTCVHLAAQLGHIHVLRHLVWCGADINVREGCAGNTALHYAALRNDSELAHFLLGECTRHLDVEQVNYNGRSALELEGDLSAALRQMMQTAGVPWGADWEDSDEDSEDEDGASPMEDDTQQMAFQRSARMVNASA